MAPFTDYQRRRWMRPNAHLYMRPDARRWLRSDYKHFLLPGADPGPLFALIEGKANFNPNQPRVPAGNPDGGQWTRVGSGGGGASTQTPDDEETIDIGGADQGAEQTGPEKDWRHEIITDDAGEESWSSVANTYRPDGSLAAQSVIYRDGSRINSEFSVGGDGNKWDERHAVTLPDGSKTVFERSGDTQTVYDGDGNQISKATWTDAGPELDATVQQVFLGPALGVAARAAKAIEAGLALFTWLSARNGPENTAVLAFNAQDFRNESTQKTPNVIWVGRLTREEVGVTCERLQNMQDFTDKAVEKVREENDYKGPADFGTKVHKKIADAVNGEGDKFFRAELSFFKSLEAYREQQVPRLTDDGIIYPEENYGKLGTYRMDALEYRAPLKTTCVYDPKTGKEGFSRSRMAELALTIYRIFPDTKRVVMVEVRPSKKN